MYTLELNYGLPGLNKFIKTAKISVKRRGKRAINGIAYALMKKKYTQMVEAELIAQDCIPDEPFDYIDVEFTWIEAAHPRDPDNVRAGSKFILDAMVNRGVIPDDTMRYIHELRDKYVKGNKRAVIIRWEGHHGT